MLIALIFLIPYPIAVLIASKLDTAINYPDDTPRFGPVPDKSISWPSGYYECYLRVYNTIPRGEVVDHYMTWACYSIALYVVYMVANIAKRLTGH